MRNWAIAFQSLLVLRLATEFGSGVEGFQAARTRKNSVLLVDIVDRWVRDLRRLVLH